MGPLIVLIFWGIIITILSIITGFGGIALGHFIQWISDTKIKTRGWFFLPGFCLTTFFSLLFVELIMYGIFTYTDIGFGDYARVNINKDYYLGSIDLGWDLMHEDSPEAFISNIDEILVLDDKIVVSKGNNVDGNSTIYRLYEVNANKKYCKYLYSARTAQTLWNKYTKEHNIDKDNVYTCHEYYWKYKQYYFCGCIIFNLLLIGFIIKKYGRRYLIKEEPIEII